MAFDPSKYTVAKARPLPVILLLDRSGSMSGEKISTLNSAVNDMIQSFKTAGQGEVGVYPADGSALICGAVVVTDAGAGGNQQRIVAGFGASCGERNE